MDNLLTAEEIAKAEACQAPEYPRDWFAQMLLTGRMARIVKRWA